MHKLKIELNRKIESLNIQIDGLNGRYETILNDLKLKQTEKINVEHYTGLYSFAGQKRKLKS